MKERSQLVVERVHCCENQSYLRKLRRIKDEGDSLVFQPPQGGGGGGGGSDMWNSDCLSSQIGSSRGGREREGMTGTLIVFREGGMLFSKEESGQHSEKKAGSFKDRTEKNDEQSKNDVHSSV